MSVGQHPANVQRGPHTAGERLFRQRLTGDRLVCVEFSIWKSFRSAVESSPRSISKINLCGEVCQICVDWLILGPACRSRL